MFPFLRKKIKNNSKKGRDSNFVVHDENLEYRFLIILFLPTQTHTKKNPSKKINEIAKESKRNNYVASEAFAIDHKYSCSIVWLPLKRISEREESININTETVKDTEEEQRQHCDPVV